MIQSMAVVTPMANEQETVVEYLAAVRAELEKVPRVRHFVILDKVSIDRTRALVEDLATREPTLVPVWAPENRNVVDAYTRGYREALASEAEWILEMDAGFSHRPDDIPRFLQAAETGVDCVFGTRFSLGGTSENSPIRRRFLSRGGTLLSNLMLGTDLTDMTSGFQMFTRSALQRILAHGIDSEGPFFQTEMKTHARSMNIVEVPIAYSSPSHDISGASVRDALKNLRALRRKIRSEDQHERRR